MNEKILICVAWPYANGSLHIGQTAGAYIPADIFARYHRAKGNDVLMVSGSDSHGTPVTLTAEDLGISPKEVFQKYFMWPSKKIKVINNGIICRFIFDYWRGFG